MIIMIIVIDFNTTQAVFASNACAARTSKFGFASFDLATSRLSHQAKSNKNASQGKVSRTAEACLVGNLLWPRKLNVIWSQHLCIEDAQQRQGKIQGKWPQAASPHTVCEVSMWSPTFSSSFLLCKHDGTSGQLLCCAKLCCAALCYAAMQDTMLSSAIQCQDMLSQAVLGHIKPFQVWPVRMCYTTASRWCLEQYARHFVL